MEWMLCSNIVKGTFSLHMAFVVRKVHLGAHSAERNLVMEDYDEEMWLSCIEIAKACF